MSAPPIPCNWDGESFVPRRGFQKLADRHYVVGESYTLLPYEDRSDVSHKHAFAWLKTAWLSLPENLAEHFASPEHLRKRALIEAGFYDETIIDAGTNAAAIRVAVALRGIDDFAAVTVKGPMVVRRTAKSQSRRAMKKDEFQRSKTAIMEIIGGLIGVAPEALEQQRAA